MSDLDSDTPKVSGIVDVSDILYGQLIDEVDADTTYQCVAEPGTVTSAAKWRIRKIVKVGTVTTIAWADGNTEFDNIADDRLTLTYS